MKFYPFENKHYFQQYRHCVNKFTTMCIQKHNFIQKYVLTRAKLQACK